MSIKKVCVVITARPSYSRIKTALTEIKNHPGLQLQLVIAASALLDRYGSVVDFIEKDGFKINEKVFMVLEGTSPATMAKTTGLGILELATAFDNLKPDLVVTVADRYETMATAIAASYMNIPLVHIQGGEVTGSIDEKVRHSITKLADLHLVASEDAYNRLIKMGEYPDSVFVTGCPSIDIAKEVSLSSDIDFDPIQKYGGVGFPVDLAKPYLMVMQHPVTTEHKEAFFQVSQTLEAVHKTNIQTLWFWPNVDAGADGTSSGIRNFREVNPNAKIRFFKNMDGLDFLKVSNNTLCLIGNSSVGIRECSFLGVPVVNIGSRQNRRERGPNVMDASYDATSISIAIETQLKNGKYPGAPIYGDGNSGKRIADILSKCDPKTNKTISY
jgi:UDP-N-acetylglucosamine 2-epimerase/N-acetylmannosamine kinase